MMSSSCFKTQNWRIQQNIEYSKCYCQQSTEYSKVLNLARITKSWKQGKVSVPRASSGRTLCSLLSNLLLPSTTLPRHQPTFMKQSKYKYKNIKIQIVYNFSTNTNTLCSLLSNLLLPSTTLARQQPTFMKQSKYKYKNIKTWICIQLCYKYKYTLLLTL